MLAVHGRDQGAVEMLSWHTGVGKGPHDSQWLGLDEQR